MFDAELEAALGDSRTLTDLAADVENDARIAGCRKLLVAAAWADAHSAVDHPDGGLLVERLVPIGPVGCPAVAEFAAQGLVGPFDASTPSVRSWMADALTIRHRLPRLWERVVAGDVHHWKARQIATLTAHLSLAAAADVDAHTTPWVEQLPWPTFLKALDATMLQVDESTYRERERLAAAKREVRATPSEAGLRTLIARGEAGDVTMMMALYQRVAECLAEEGDEDPLPVRMSKAIGIIANPARLTDLLARHADDPDPHREPWEKVAAHQGDATDPWADDLPPAGWESAEHGNYHQPGMDEEGWWGCPGSDDQPDEDRPADPPPDPDDQAWFDDNLSTSDDVSADAGTTEPPVQQRWPVAFRRPGWQPLAHPPRRARRRPHRCWTDHPRTAATVPDPARGERHDPPGQRSRRHRVRRRVRDPTPAPPGDGDPAPTVGVPTLPVHWPPRPRPHRPVQHERTTRANRHAQPRAPGPQ